MQEKVDRKEEISKKKEYLNSYKGIEREIKLISEKIQALRLDKMCPSMNYSDMPRSGNQTDMSDYAVAYDELMTKYKKARYKRLMLLTKIEREIDKLTEQKERELLFLRYIKGLHWEEICVDMGYGWRQIHYIHAKALSNYVIEGDKE